MVTLFIRDKLANFLHVKCSSMWRRFATNPSSFLYSINALSCSLCVTIWYVYQKNDHTYRAIRTKYAQVSISIRPRLLNKLLFSPFLLWILFKLPSYSLPYIYVKNYCSEHLTRLALHIYLCEWIIFCITPCMKLRWENFGMWRN